MQPRMLRGWMQAIFWTKARQSTLQDSLQVTLRQLADTVNHSFLYPMILQVLTVMRYSQNFGQWCLIQRVLKKIGVLKSLVPGNPEDKPSEDVEANASSSKSSKQQLSLVQTKVACLQLLLLRVQHLALSPPGRQDMGLHVVMPWMPGLWVNPA